MQARFYLSVCEGCDFKCGVSFIRVARPRPAAHLAAVVFWKCWGLVLEAWLYGRCCGAETHLRYRLTGHSTRRLPPASDSATIPVKVI